MADPNTNTAPIDEDKPEPWEWTFARPVDRGFVELMWAEDEADAIRGARDTAAQHGVEVLVMKIAGKAVAEPRKSRFTAGPVV